ncbi:hypothetical protein JXA32_15675 [Candidatus Sumerlaeota bacterium]|nr:hypothetical protein [Candidatus Sumerlaeota bacterium]
MIGHVKSESRMERDCLVGVMGDKLNVILAACGFNLRKLMRGSPIFCAFCFSRGLCSSALWLASGRLELFSTVQDAFSGLQRLDSLIGFAPQAFFSIDYTMTKINVTRILAGIALKQNKNIAGMKQSSSLSMLM